jgi:hypothetical protein
MPLARSGAGPGRPRELLSDDLERWLADEGDKTVGSLVGLFGRQGLYVELQRHRRRDETTDNQALVELASAFRVPIALQLIVGRERIWLPQRWCALSLAGLKQQRFMER